MNTQDNFSRATRDALVIDAIRQALIAMELINGCRIDTDGICGTLHFEREIVRMRTALILLGSNFEPGSGG